MAQLKEMDVAEAVQRLNEVEYGHYMFKVPYDSIKQGQQWIELSKKYLNKKVWSISTRFTGPRKGFGASTLKADATGVRVYITKKNQKNIDEERFQRSMGKLKENSYAKEALDLAMQMDDEKAYISVLKHPHTKQLEEKIKTLEDELEAVHTVDETLTKQLEEKISLLEDENSKLVDDWESKECDYIEEAETLRSENLDYEQREEELENQIEQLREDIADKELDEKDLYKLIDELEKNIEEHKNYVEKNWFLKLVYIIKNWSNK